jgi:polar amino acid transport system permease protein
MSLGFFLDLFPQLIAGTITTLWLLVLSAIFGNALAIAVAIARISPNPLLRWPSQAYCTVIRGTPLLVQMYLIYYGLGNVFAHTPAVRSSIFWPYLRDGFWYAVFALVVSTGAYTGEILRGAMEAVPAGEIEAGRSLGLSRRLILRLIVLPRAIRMALPALSGETILLLKSTALASTVTVMDMMGVANYIRSQTFRIYETLLAAAVIYIVLTFLLTRGFLFMERRLAAGRERPVLRLRKTA